MRIYSHTGTYCSIALIIAAAVAVNVHAENISLDAIGQGLSDVQQVTESADKTLQSATQTMQSGQQAVATAVDQTSLTETLVKQLGITTQQAQGGAGAVFQAAKGQLNAEQFSSLSNSVPEMETLLNAAPKQSASLTGLAGSVSSLMGDENNTFGNLAGLTSSFKALNFSPDMVDQFVPAIVDYVRGKGGAMTADMLQSALYGN